MFALPIFPGSHPPSIVGANELNFCVRDGNRWTLIAINTNSYGWVLPIFYIKVLSDSNILYTLPLTALKLHAVLTAEAINRDTVSYASQVICW